MKVVPIVAVAGLMLTSIGLVLTFKRYGADELRSSVYVPLHGELVDLDRFAKGRDATSTLSMDVFRSLQRSGSIQRIPSGLRNQISRVYDNAGAVSASMRALQDLLVREMSSRILSIRTERSDELWSQKTSQEIQRTYNPGRGVPDTASLGTFEHEYRGQIIDTRTGRPVAPGGPVFVIDDWLEYPQSLDVIERQWSDVDYLYFNVRQTGRWYYRITRQDLASANLRLREFLDPVAEILKTNDDFQYLTARHQSLIDQIGTVQQLIAERIVDPKQLRDLIN